jgi:hypothetical protein
LAPVVPIAAPTGMNETQFLLGLAGEANKFMAYYTDGFGSFKIRMLEISSGAELDILNGSYNLKSAVDIPEMKSFVKVEDIGGGYKLYVMDYGFYTKFDLTISNTGSAMWAKIVYMPVTLEIGILTNNPTNNFQIYGIQNELCDPVC